MPDFSLVTGSVYDFFDDDGAGNTTQLTVEVDTATNQFWGFDTNGQVLWGTAGTMASGFLRLTQTNSTDPEDLGTLPQTLFGLEIPNAMLLIVPKDSLIANEGYAETDPGLILTGSTRAGADVTANMLAAPDPSYNQLTGGAFGEAIRPIATENIDYNTFLLGEDFTGTASASSIFLMAGLGNGQYTAFADSQ